MKVYLLVREGPEWSDVVGVYTNAAKAEARASELNRKGDALRRDKNATLSTVQERLSSYSVAQHTVIE